MREIRRIEPSSQPIPARKRVAAYARVSSGKDAQLQSLSAQVSYYSNFIQKEATTQQDECDVVMELIRKCVEENAHTALDQDEYQTRYSALLTRYETAKNRLDKITEEKQSRAAKRESISRFISDIERCSGLLTEFDEALWYETVETVTVHSENDVAVAFKDGSEVHVDVGIK